MSATSNKQLVIMETSYQIQTPGQVRIRDIHEHYPELLDEGGTLKGTNYANLTFTGCLK